MNNLHFLSRVSLAVFVLALPVVLMGADVEAGERTLKAKEVRALFPGRFEARVRGYRINVVARGNGSLAGSTFSRTDKGRWWVKGNALCVACSNWTDGRPTCGRITRAGNWHVSANASGNAMKFKRN